MTHLVAVALAIFVDGLTCETSGDMRHCFDHRGYESTEERSGEYVHGVGA
jgi:hypothetical protein